MEWITGHYRLSCRKGGPHYCGRRPAVMAAEFRTRIRTGIQAIAAKVVGRIMARSGYYPGGHRYV